MKLTIDQFIKREVICNISMTIDALRDNALSMEDGLQLYESNEAIDYEGTFQVWYDSLDDDDIIDLVERYQTTADELEYILRREFESDKQDFIEIEKIEPETIEVFEHWAVTSFLANKLEAAGEKIIWDMLDFKAVWCRTTTGQQLTSDEVIEDIYKSFVG